MKGIVRALDELGRITLPMEFRKSFGIEVKENAPIGICIEGNVIQLHIKPVVFKGMVRCLDELGRLTLPKEIRKSLKFDDHELVDIWVQDNRIRIRKASLQCVLCGFDDESNLLEVDGVLICRTCALNIADKLLEG